MKSYVISNGWSDDNKGDSAIVDGLLSALSSFGKAEFVIISSFSSDSPHYISSARHLENRHNIRLLPNPVFHRCPINRMRKSQRLVDFIKSLLLLLAPATAVFLLDDKQKLAVDALRSANCVIGKGGHYLFGSDDVRGLATLYFNSYTLLLAKRLGTRTALSANSVGPFMGRSVRLLAKYIFSKLDVLQVRESASKSVLKDLGISGAIETYDTAFMIKNETLPSDTPSLQEYVVLTARQWDFPYSSGLIENRFEKYLEALIQAALFFAQRGLSIVLAPQVIGPTALEDDRVVNNELHQRLSSEGVSVTLLDRDYSPGQLKTLYSNARFLIGTRFHSVILALASGTPVIAISYHGPKAPGIMAQLGLANYVLDIDKIKVEDIIKKCDALFKDEFDLRERIALGVSIVAKKINQDVKDILSD